MIERSIDDGYGVSTGYTYGYYRQLSPTWLRFVAAARGLTIPDGEPFRYFELGFGQGVSLNVHAAANSGEYWGNDYNPEHVAFARRMAEASGANVHLLGDSFEELAQRRDLPQFHMVVAHGIWSWISDSTRAAIMKFLDEHLAPGGVFYVSYNALPGSASGIAAQRFLHTLTASLDNSLSERERFDMARSHLGLVKDAVGNHFDRYPKARQRLEKILHGKSSYYLHEYTVGTWRPELLLEVSAQLKQVGLEFCGSADLNPADLDALPVADGTDAIAISETLRDFRMDREFRADLFVRSPSRFSARPTMSSISDLGVALTCVPEEVEADPEDPEAPDGEGTLASLLAEVQQQSLSRMQISDLLALAGQTRSQQALVSGLVFSLNRGLMHPLKANPVPGFFERCKNLNQFLSKNVARDHSRQLRASPIIGAAVKLPILYGDVHHKDADPKEVMQNLAAQSTAPKRLSALQIVKYAAHYKSRLRLMEALSIDP